MIYIFLLYPLEAYIDYRIIRKFGYTTRYVEMLIPFWNIYLVDRTAMGKPNALYYFWGSIIVIAAMSIATKSFADDYMIKKATDLLFFLILNFPVVFIAEKLGKNLWLYLVLAIVVPLIIIFVANREIGVLLTIAIRAILAFDNSKPISKERDLCDTPPVNSGAS